MENINIKENKSPVEQKHLHRYYIGEMKLGLEFLTLDGHKRYFVFLDVRCESCSFTKFESRCLDEVKYYKYKRLIDKKQRVYTYLSDSSNFYNEFEPRI